MTESLLLNSRSAPEKPQQRETGKEKSEGHLLWVVRSGLLCSCCCHQNSGMIKQCDGGLGPHLIVSTFPQSVAQLVSPFTSALTFPLCLFSSPSGHDPNITLQPRTRCNITPKAQSKQNLSTYCFALQSQTPISAVAHVRETVHVAKCLNPPLLCFCCPGLAIPPQSLLAIYIWVSKFFHSYTVRLVLEQQTVENVSVLRKGEYHNKGV